MAVDALDAQALEVQAQDLALEDTLYVLQKAFQDGLLDAPSYLRQVCGDGVTLVLCAHVALKGALHVWTTTARPA